MLLVRFKFGVGSSSFRIGVRRSTNNHLCGELPQVHSGFVCSCTKPLNSSLMPFSNGESTSCLWSLRGWSSHRSGSVSLLAGYGLPDSWGTDIRASRTISSYCLRNHRRLATSGLSSIREFRVLELAWRLIPRDALLQGVFSLVSGLIKMI